MKEHSLELFLLGIVILLGLVLISFGSFNHQNPLTAKTSDAALNKAATFLYSAAKASEPEVIKQYHLSYRPGDLYASCMSGEESNDKACAVLYHLMQQYAALQRASSYYTVSISDIADNDMWTMLKDNYDYVQFNDF